MPSLNNPAFPLIAKDSQTRLASVAGVILKPTIIRARKRMKSKWYIVEELVALIISDHEWVITMWKSYGVQKHTFGPKSIKHPFTLIPVYPLYISSNPQQLHLHAKGNLLWIMNLSTHDFVKLEQQSKPLLSQGICPCSTLWKDYQKRKEPSGSPFRGQKNAISELTNNWHI